MKTVAIIQARMGSTRLPGKVLLDIGGATMLARVVGRTRRAASLDQVVVATSVKTDDEPIVSECGRLGVEVFRGDEQDVLDRFYRAARAYQADAVVRITADCPLIDPDVIDRVVGEFMEALPEYASNTLRRTYPRGLDTEVVAFGALECAWHEASEPYQRSHVTPYLYENPDRFRLLSVTHPTDLSQHRWTVDTQEDLAFVRQVYRSLRNLDTIRWLDLLALLEREPALGRLNWMVQQKALDKG